jgi:hypothetical protein
MSKHVRAGFTSGSKKIAVLLFQYTLHTGREQPHKNRVVWSQQISGYASWYYEFDN